MNSHQKGLHLNLMCRIAEEHWHLDYTVFINFDIQGTKGFPQEEAFRKAF